LSPLPTLTWDLRKPAAVARVVGRGYGRDLCKGEKKIERRS
jgi:hypothetical protein